MKKKQLTALLLSAAMALSLLSGCGGNAASSGSSASQESAGETESQGIREYTAFFAVPGTEINDDNEIQAAIADITGARVKETWLTGQTAQEAVGTMIAGGEYPDFIDGSDGQIQLYEAGALVALDDYLDNTLTSRSSIPMRNGIRYVRKTEKSTVFPSSEISGKKT